MAELGGVFTFTVSNVKKSLEVESTEKFSRSTVV